jgi:NADPH2:quinone reductase
MQQLFVLAGGQVAWEDAPDPAVAATDVEIDVHASGVSVGTETRFVQRWAKEAAGKRDLGYSAAGVVRSLGAVAAERTGLEVGQSVASYGGPYTRHATRLAVPWTLVAPVPDSVTAEEAAFCGIGAISMHAIRRGAFTGGEAVMVLGMGILGQLAEQMLRAWGCRTLAVDRHTEHLELAARLGCRDVFDARAGDVRRRPSASPPAGWTG